MTAASKSVVKSYFESGDTPTGTNFSTLVDSYADHAIGADVEAARAPYATLSARLTALVLAGGNVATMTNGTISAAQKVVLVDSTTGFVAGGRVAYLLAGGTVEYNVIATIDSAGQFTAVTNVGTGGIADNTYISMIDESTYQAAVAINYGNSVVPTLDKAMTWAAQGVYNILAYGASPSASGAVNRAAINAAITACNAAGGGIVTAPPGVFEFTVGAHPNPSVTLTCGIVMRSKVELACAGIGATIFKLADDQNINDISRCITHYYYGGLTQGSGGVDTNMTFRDFTLDGNAANQGSGTKLRDTGIQIYQATHIRHERVEVKDVYGEGGGGSPSNEGFNFTASVCQYVWYTDCVGDGSEAFTSTMFGLSSCSFVHYSNSKAMNGANGNGFANNNSSHVVYDGCQAPNNKLHGFNLEFSRFVQHTGCTAGGIPAMEASTNWQGTNITGISKASVAVVTAAGHGLAVGDYVYIGGNSNPVTDTTVVGMVEIADNIYKIGTVPTADTVTLQDYAGTNLDTSGGGYTAYVSGGVICKIAGNIGAGFRCHGGRDIVYDGCISIANGFAASDILPGLIISGPTLRVSVIGGNYSYNRSSGIITSGATTGEIKFMGTPFVVKNYATGYAPGIRGIGSSSTLSADAAAAATSISVTDATLDLTLANGNFVEIQLDNGDTHIAVLSAKAGSGPYTFTIAPGVPTKASAGKNVWLNRRPAMALPATAQLSLPATAPTTAVVYTNQYPFPVIVALTGGTSVSTLINGTDTLLGTDMMYLVPAGGTISILHAGAPTWKWMQGG